MVSPLEMNAIPPRDPDSGRVNVIMDTPAGSRNKYRYDSELGVYRLSRQLPEGLVFPHDFGSIPCTCAADGDALDVLVLDADGTFPGCLVTVRLVGVLYARQREGGKALRNDRLVAVVETSVNRAPMTRLADLQPERLRAIEHFFESYNAFQGRQFRISGRGTARRAEHLLDRAITAFRRRKSP